MRKRVAKKLVKIEVTYLEVKNKQKTTAKIKNR